MIRPRLWLAAVLAAELGACQPAGGGAGRLLVVDDAGDTTWLSGPARRIVSLNPATTELIFALGVGPRLVGRTDDCKYPAAARAIPSVGGWLPPNVEAVAARAPDLVLLYQGSTNAIAAARLRALGIAVVALRSDRLADVSRLAHRLGPILGVARRADSLASSYDTALDSLRRSLVPDPARSVVLLAWDQPLIVLGAGSFVSEMIELAGARNVFGDLPAASVPVSLESLVSRRPRAVVTVGALSTDFSRRPEWQAVRAVHEHRLLSLTETAVKWPSPRAPAAVAGLRARLDSALITHASAGAPGHGR
ncbi:MAG: ABC transporter substrate-binding protein [Gemmatimonadales bacterium]